MRKEIIILIIYLLSLDGLLSQGDMGALTFTRYGIEDGLPNMSMRVIGQDSTGYIWLSDPLTRFDGATFKTVTLSDKNISSRYINAISMSDDGEGNILFSGKEGIYHYNSLTQQIRAIPSNSCNTLSRRIFHSDPYIFFDLCRDNLVKIDLRSLDTTVFRLDHFDHNNNSGINDGNRYFWIWQIGDNRCGRYDLRDMSLEEFGLDFYEENHWWNYRFGEDGEVLLLSTGGLFLLDEQDRKFERVFDSRKFLEDQNQRFDQRTEFRYYGDSCIWFVDPVNDEVHRYDLTNEEIRSILYGGDKIFTRRIYDKYNAIEMEDGVLLSGTRSSGLLEVDILNQRIHQYKADKGNPNALLNNFVIAELKTDDHTYFLCGSGQGLIKAERKKKMLQHYKLPTPKSNIDNYNNIRSILEYQGKILVTSIRASYLFDPIDEKLTPLVFPEELPKYKNYMGIDAIAKDSFDNLLVIFWSQDNDIIFNYLDYENNRMVSLSEYIPNVTFLNSNTLFIDSKENYWVPTSHEIIRIPAIDLKNKELGTVHQQWQRFDLIRELKIEDDAVTTYAIEEDNDGNIWVGTSSGLFRIDTNTLRITLFENEYNQSNSLSHNNVRSIRSTSNGELWVGTAGGGLNRFDFKSESFELFDMNSGLPDNVIYSIADDSSGALWLGTNKGLCKFDPQSLTYKIYTSEDGAQDYEYNTDAVCRTKSGQLYFGGVNGFNRVDPTAIKTGKVDQKLVISSFKINDVETPITNSKIELKHDENFIKFQFNLLDYYHTDQIQYAYQLTGLDSDWVYAGNRNEAIYPGLNPGDYTFKVKAANSEGQWSNQLIQEKIHIAKPWYGQWWFYLLCFLIVAGIAFAFYLNRRKQKELIIELRNKISRDLHDEIGSTLSSISLFGTVAHKMVTSDQESTKKMLQRINDSTTNVMESMNDIVWTINSENDKVNDLLMRMRAYISELIDASDIRVTLKVDDSIKNSNLNMIQKRNVYLIFKEAVNNAFKYADASVINIQLQDRNKYILLSIKDDGKGFDPNAANKDHSLGGNGLNNIKRRAKEMGGTVDIISEKEKGTEIKFRWNPKILHK